MERATIFIPTYNRAKYLRQCLVALTSQEIAPDSLDIIISDNASTDDTVSVVDSFRTRLSIRYYRNDENLGIIRNYNRIVELDSSRLVALVADDVLLSPGFLRRALHVLAENGDTPLFATTMLQVLPQVHIPYYPQVLAPADLWPIAPRPLSSREWAASCAFRCPVYTGSCVFRRDFLDRAMPWRTDLLDNADRVMYFAAWRTGVPIAFEPWVGATTVYDGHNVGSHLGNNDDEYRAITAEFVDECFRTGFDVLGFWRERLRSASQGHRDHVLLGAYKALPNTVFEREFADFISWRRRLRNRLRRPVGVIRSLAVAARSGRWMPRSGAP